MQARTTATGNLLPEYAKALGHPHGDDKEEKALAIKPMTPGRSWKRCPLKLREQELAKRCQACRKPR